jgi:hypothetical protein
MSYYEKLKLGSFCQIKGKALASPKRPCACWSAMNPKNEIASFRAHRSFVRGRVADLSLGAARAIGLFGSARVTLAH